MTTRTRAAWPTSTVTSLGSCHISYPAPPYRERRSAAAARRSGRSASGAAAPRPGTRRWRPGVFRGPCLLLRAEGLHSCPQMAWSVYRRTVAEVVGPPPELVLLA